MPSKRGYHHGDLRRALLSAAATEITEVGLAAMSVRRVAARAGVTHTAAAHHFGDKRGLLTALATEGHRALAEAMAAARPGGMVALGEAYLRFAHDHRPFFEVMFRPELVDVSDPEYVEASRSSFGELRGASGDGGGGDLAYGGWALVHGTAVLWLAGNLPASTLEEAQDLFRRSAWALARGRRRPRPAPPLTAG